MLAVELHERSQCATGFLCGLHAGLARACIGIARVDDQCPDLAAGGKVLLTNQNGRRAETVSGKHSGDIRSGAQAKYRQVTAVCLADACFGDTDFDTGDGKYRVIRRDVQINGHV